MKLWEGIGCDDFSGALEVIEHFVLKLQPYELTHVFHRPLRSLDETLVPNFHVAFRSETPSSGDRLSDMTRPTPRSIVDVVHSPGDLLKGRRDVSPVPNHMYELGLLKQGAYQPDVCRVTRSLIAIQVLAATLSETAKYTADQFRIAVNGSRVER